MSLKNSSDTIGNGTSDLSASSAVSSANSATSCPPFYERESTIMASTHDISICIIFLKLGCNIVAVGCPDKCYVLAQK